MSTGEIKVVKAELDNCRDKLRSLSSSCASLHDLYNSALGITTSKGKSKNTVVDCTDMTKQVRTALWSLLDSSAGYFDSVAASFQNADDKAAQNIDTLTN